MTVAKVFLLVRSGLYGMWQRFEAVFVGAALGLLSRELLYAIDEQHYRRAARYHGPEWNLSGLLAWEQQAVNDWFGTSEHVAVLGAGGGREVIALARAGHAAEGFECNPELVDVGTRLLARENGQGRLQLLPRDEVPTGRFSALIMGWSSYMLIPGRDRRVAMLRRLRELLPDDAPLLVSFYTRDGVLPRLQRIARVGTFIRKLMRRPPVELGDDLVPNYVHWFTREEIEAELRDGGFRMVTFQPQGAGPTDSGYAVGLRASEESSVLPNTSVFAKHSE